MNPTSGGLSFYDFFLYLYGAGLPSIGVEDAAYEPFSYEELGLSQLIQVVVNEIDDYTPVGGSTIYDETAKSQLILAVASQSNSITPIEGTYSIERRLNLGGTWVEIASQPTTTLTDSYELNSGNTYYYRVRQYTSGSWSDYSNVLEVLFTYNVGLVQVIKTIITEVDTSNKVETALSQVILVEDGEWDSDTPPQFIYETGLEQVIQFVASEIDNYYQGIPVVYTNPHEVADYLYSRLPDVYRIEDEEIDYPLRTYLRILGGGYDSELGEDITGLELIRNETRNILELMTVQTVTNDILNLIGDNFGFPNNLSLLEDYYRKLVGNIVYIYKQKTSLALLQNLGRILSGEDFEITHINPQPSPGVHGGREEYTVKFGIPMEDPWIVIKESAIRNVLEYLRPVICWFDYQLSNILYEIFNANGDLIIDGNFHDTVSDIYIESMTFGDFFITNDPLSITYQTGASYKLLFSNKAVSEYWVDTIT